MDKEEKDKIKKEGDKMSLPLDPSTARVSKTITSKLFGFFSFYRCS